jgi:hypothetical protein
MNTDELGKLELLPLLVNAALKCCQTLGSDERWGSAGIIRVVEVPPFSMVYRTPRAMIFEVPTNFGIDVWFEGKKTLSVCWNSDNLRDYEIINLKRGPWIPLILKLSKQEAI